MPPALVPLCGYLQTRKGRCSGISFVDSTSLKVCHNRRIHSHKVFEGCARRGKTSVDWFFGFKPHALRHISGRVLSLLLTPANYDDRELADGVEGGVSIGDLGYRGPECAEALADEAEVLLITRADAPNRKFLLSQVRQGVETMFSQWWHQFIDRVFSRSWEGLWNSIKLKVLR